MDLTSECRPLGSLIDHHTITGFQAWQSVVDSKGSHALLGKDYNHYRFGVKGVEPELYYDNEALSSAYKNWIVAVGGVKLLANFNTALIFKTDADNCEEVEINSPITWVPEEEKYLTLHHYMMSNLMMALFFQREADEIHQIECALCNCLRVCENRMNSIVELYLHAKEKHVQKFCHPKTVELSNAVIDPLTKMPNVSFDSDFGNTFESMKATITSQTMNKF